MTFDRLKTVFFVTFLITAPAIGIAAEKVRIVTTTSTLGSLAAHITGGEAEIHTVASPKRDIHFVSPTPKDVLKVKKADVFIHLGLDAEPWRGPLLEAAGNAAFLGGGERAIDASRGVGLLEIPSEISRKEGDIHLYGNPHYWGDPENAAQMARNIAEGLGRLYPDRADFFRERAAAFNAELGKKLEDWKARLAPYRGTKIITYHNSWIYFARRFDFIVAGQVEPKPGIPPASRHIASLIQLMKKEKIPLIAEESYYEERTPRKIAEAAGAQVVQLALSVGEVKEAGDYIQMMEFNVSSLEKALKKEGPQ